MYKYEHLKHLNSVIVKVTDMYKTISTGHDEVWTTKISFFLTILSKRGDKMTRCLIHHDTMTLEVRHIHILVADVKAPTATPVFPDQMLV